MKRKSSVLLVGLVLGTHLSGCYPTEEVLKDTLDCPDAQQGRTNCEIESYQFGPRRRRTEWEVCRSDYRRECVAEHNLRHPEDG